MKTGYEKTVAACFVGYIVQAIVNNFAPLLFLTFQSQFGIPLSQITALITFNFGLQLLVDFASVGFVDRIGYRATMVIAHGASALGLVLMTVLPEAMPDPFAGLMLAVGLYAVGGGLLEVTVSPVVESCPTKNKEQSMSLLHSFYCWGHVGVVLLSTIFFRVFGVENWRYMALLWALLPAVNGIVFLKVPMMPLLREGERGMTLRELMETKLFWIIFLMMLCAGASEQAVSQWASTFAEKGLGVNKTIGDLAGPMAFAVMMGTSRAVYGKFGDRLNLDRFMSVSCVLCIASYLLIWLTKSPVLGLAGCALCGFAVGIFWPGTFSKAAAALPTGGTAMFAMLALAGDLGCSSGPSLVGFLSGCFGDDLKKGIACALVFPILLLLGLWSLRRERKSPVRR